MINTNEKNEKRALPPWVAIAAIAIVLVGIILYGVHVLRGQAPNSDFKTPTSYHAPMPPASAVPTNH